MSMEVGNDAEWIISRKIVVKSLTRHFAPWKSRFFVLDRAQALLGVRSSSNDALLVISLASPSLSIQRHEYSVDEQYLLTLKYKDEDSPTCKEIVMKFDSIGHLTYWEKALQSAAANVRSITATSTRALFNTFLEYVNEQSQLQRIVQDESEHGARYYEGTTTDSEARILTEDAVDSISSSFMSSSAGSIDNHRAAHNLATTAARTGASHADLACDRITLADSDLQDGALAARVQLKPLNVPHMRILLVAVGTRGDMQPFVQLGLRLQRDGHRVRLATHACFRESVTSKGLEFYPLAGDPLKLSEFMVKTQGFVIPTTPELMMQAPIYHQMVVDMMYSCWGACVEPDPLDPAAKKFVADAIISNPVSYAHIHCAEALGIPLHLMFPQPWTPTKAFPHPLSCLSYQQGWSAENFISYQLVDSMLWMSFERQINAFRVNILGLQPLRVGEGGWNHLNIMKVPFVKMWSPSFVPKPKDWPSYVDVVGTFFDALPALPKPIAPLPVNSLVNPLVTTAATTARGSAGGAAKPISPFLDVDYTPPAGLMRFLAAGDTPVFVGFGSMVIKDLEGLISLFLEGAALAGVRIIVQVGWSSIKPERFLELALQAQLKASIVRETELMNDNMASSLIFPSTKPPAKARTTGSDKVGGPSAGASSVVDLSMSMRSVQSTSTVDSGEGDEFPDESTLDGERVSVGTRESESGRMYTSSITGSVANSAYRAHSSDKDEVPFDSSPIGSPARIPSAERKPGNLDAASTGAGGESKSGLGNWLIGAAMNLSKTFQPTSQSQSDPRTGSAAGERISATRRVDSADEHENENDISASWDEVAGDSWSAAKDAFFMGPCPHDWLFQRVAGVVHHGGAGTTAAGLRFGCPTWICPFFGDQHFWGEMVHRRQVGPRPCPIGALTLPVVAESLAALKDETIVRNAAALADSMRQEDGVEGACAAFYKHLPVENMICDVSLFRGEYRLAQVYCKDCGFKMCNEVSQQLHTDPSLHMQDHRVGPCCYKDWTRHGPNSAAEGLLQGIGGLVHELKEGVSDILYDPVRGIYTEGISGAAAGLSTGLNSLLSRPLAGGSVLLNKVKEGIRASLASNLNYRVKASPYDPLSGDGGNYALVDKAETERNNAGGSSPLAPKAQLTTPARALKVGLQELPPVLASAATTEGLDAFSPGGKLLVLSESPLAAQAHQALLNAAPVSPRNASTANLLEMSVLERSIRSTASRDSSAFYGSKDKEGADAADSDGDESVYYEEENIPFLLYTSDTLKHPMKQLSSQALSSSTPSTGSSNVAIQAAGSGNNSDSAAGTSLPEPDSAPVNASPPALSATPAATLALPADALVLEESPVRLKLQARNRSAETLTVREAFDEAQMAQRLFRNLGAENGRFIAPRDFGRVMHRAILRDTALTAVDAVDTVPSAAAPEAAPQHRSPLHAYARKKEVGEVNETSTNALVQMIAHGKRYVDFVDFSMIYMQLCDATDEK